MIRFAAAAVLVLALGACAAAGGPSSPTTGPAASELPHTVWAPAGRPQAVIVAVHGFNDYRAAFSLFGPWAAERGYRVEAYDQRGFGENPDRGRWPGRDVLVGDLRARLADARRRFPGTPLFVLGVSMGAAVATLALASEPTPDVDGAILGAPATWGGEAMNPFYRGLLWVAARLFPDLEVTGQSLGRQASDNIEVLRALARDPLFIKRTKLRAVEGLVQLMGDAYAAAPRLRLPTLVLVGEKDEIVPPAAQIAFARRLGSENCRLVRYPEGWHMLLRDLQRERVWRDIVAWIERRPLPSGFDVPCGETAVQQASAPSWRSSQALRHSPPP